MKPNISSTAIEAVGFEPRQARGLVARLAIKAVAA
jgi:hypothetical protein